MLDSSKEVIVCWIVEGFGMFDLDGSYEMFVFFHVAGSVELCFGVEGSVDPLLELSKGVDVSVRSGGGQYQVKQVNLLLLDRLIMVRFNIPHLSIHTIQQATFIPNIPIILCFHIIITMGNATHHPNQQPLPNNISHAYLANVLKGVKQEVDSTVEVQIIASQEAYLQWKKDSEAYKTSLAKAFHVSTQVICGLFLFPTGSQYRVNPSICGNKEGRVVLQFGSGMLSLQQSKLLHIQENTPFTAFQIWNLLFTLVQLNIMIKKAGLDLDIRSQSIYVDLRTKTIKLKNAYSFIGMQSQRYTHEKYIDTQKLELLVRRLKISKEVESRNEDFNIGMMVAEIMLLQTSCMIYDDGLTSHKTINPVLHHILIEKVLTVSYYPLKLRIIVAGLIQFESKYRFTSEEVSKLLRQERNKIKSFTTFHLRKTSFEGIFKQKLTNVQGQLSKLKQMSNAFLYKQQMPLTFGPQQKKRDQARPIKLKPVFSKVTQEVQVHPDQTINLSITNLDQANRKSDLSSLILSKSQQKSSIHQRQSREPSFNLTNSMDMKYSPRSNPPKIHKATSNPFQEIQKHPIQQSLIQPKEILSATKPQPIEIRSSQFCQQISSSLKASQEKPQQHLRELVNLKESQLKEQKQKQKQHLSIHSMEQQDFPFQSKLQYVQSEKNIKLQPDKGIEQAQISYISRKERSQQERASRNSSVRQYVSQLYEAERVVQTPSEVTHTENSPSREVQSEERKFFESSEHHQGLVIRKVDSLMGPDRSSMPDPNSSVVISHHMKTSHKDSIIDGLTPYLGNSKKSFEDSFKPQNLSESAKKKVEYFNTFAKFSPEVIAGLKLSTNYPNSQNLKREMRETISLSSMMINKTRKMFPEEEGAGGGVGE